MKSTTFIGIALIVLGVFALGYNGFAYQSQGEMFDRDGMQVTTTDDKTIPLSPLFGVLSLVGGIALIIVGYKLKGKNLEGVELRDYPRSYFNEKIIKETL